MTLWRVFVGAGTSGMTNLEGETSSEESAGERNG